MSNKYKYILYYYSLCPFSRKIRYILSEFGINYTKKEVEFWEKKDRDILCKYSYIAQPPILFDVDKNISYIDSYIIADILINDYDNNTKKDNKSFFYNFYSDNQRDKIEIQKLEMIFDKNFYFDITRPILEEKVYNNFIYGNMYKPNNLRIKSAIAKINDYLEYIQTLLLNNNYLVGLYFTLADITVATHLSLLDYFGEIAWDKFYSLKEWYLPIKSKPAFRNILDDKIPYLIPSKYYKQLDF